MDKKETLIEFIFDNMLRNHLELEKIIYEAYGMYNEINDDRIKYIIERNIVVGRNQIFMMLELLTHTKEDIVRENFEKSLNSKLADLKEIEGKLKKTANK